MITKASLVRLLEPFEDEIEIVVQDREHKFLYSPSIFYVMSDEARLVLSNTKPNGKVVELKIR